MHLPDYDRLDSRSQSQFRKALQRLVFTGSLQFVLDEDKADYQTIRDHRQSTEEWLSIADIQLVVDDDYGIICIHPIGENTGRWEVDKLRTRDEFALLAILRVALEEERSRTGAGFHRVTILEIRNQYHSRLGSNLPSKRLTTILPKFRRMKFISFTGAADEGDNSVLILPYLLYITPKDISEMIAVVQKAAIVDETDEIE